MFYPQPYLLSLDRRILQKARYRLWNTLDLELEYEHSTGLGVFHMPVSHLGQLTPARMHCSTAARRPEFVLFFLVRTLCYF